MRYTLLVALVIFASVKTLSPMGEGNHARRMIAIPKPVKDAMNKVWGELKGDLNNLKNCMANAAVASAKASVMSALPTNAGSFLKMVGVRRLGMLGSMKKKMKGAACKAVGKKALGACKSAVSSGVKKAAAEMKKKAPKIDTGKAQGCLKTFGEAMCNKAYKKACGRRLGMPSQIKKVMNKVWNELKGDLNNLKTCMAGAAVASAKASVMSALPTNAGGFMKMMGARRLGMLGGIKKKMKGAACKAVGKKALSACKSVVSSGVKKAAAEMKKKAPKIDTGKAQGCLKTFGEAMCTKAYKKACN